VCCVVTLAAGGSTSLNQSYIVQASSSSISVGSKTYQICPASTDIRRIRLDFTIFTLAGPNTGVGTVATGTTGTFTGGGLGDCTQDAFVMTSSGGASSPVICGTNTGQHMIVDNDGQGCSTVNINIGGGTFTRAYDLKITQYREGDESGGPMGCLQYFEESQNMIRSFNFPVTKKGANFVDSVVHLSNQDYNVCIRRASGMFQICYIACTNQAATGATGKQNSFGLSVSPAAALQSQIGTGCTSDFIEIPNGLAKQTSANAIAIIPKSSRFCGRSLHTASGTAIVNGNTISVCSLSIPFRLGVHTDANEVIGSGATAILNESNGFPGGIVGFQLCYLQS